MSGWPAHQGPSRAPQPAAGTRQRLHAHQSALLEDLQHNPALLTAAAVNLPRVVPAVQVLGFQGRAQGRQPHVGEPRARVRVWSGLGVCNRRTVWPAGCRQHRRGPAGGCSSGDACLGLWPALRVRNYRVAIRATMPQHT